MPTLTRTELTQAVKYANWDLGYKWGAVRDGLISLCPASYILLARHGTGLREVDGHIYPTPEFLQEANDILYQLSKWADKAGLLRMSDVEDTVVDMFVKQSHIFVSKLPRD